MNNKHGPIMNTVPTILWILPFMTFFQDYPRGKL